MGVSINGGTPKSSIVIGFSLINHPFGGTPMAMETPICLESNRDMFLIFRFLVSRLGGVTDSWYSAVDDQVLEVIAWQDTPTNPNNNGQTFNILIHIIYIFITCCESTITLWNILDGNFLKTSAPSSIPGSSGTRRSRTFKGRCLSRCANWVKEGLRVLTQLQFGTCWKMLEIHRDGWRQAIVKGERGPVRDSSRMLHFSKQTSREPQGARAFWLACATLAVRSRGSPCGKPPEIETNTEQ